jgi:hypothetical protein
MRQVARDHASDARDLRLAAGDLRPVGRDLAHIRLPPVPWARRPVASSCGVRERNGREAGAMLQQ